VRDEYQTRLDKIKVEFAEQGLNVAEYWANPDIRSYINIVPTSAITGEGVPDLLYLLCKLTQTMLGKKLQYTPALQCTVLEVKAIEGLGTTVDVILINGVLKEGSQVVLCGLNGPIVTNIRALLTPHPMKEMRVKGSYLHHKTIKAAMGVKITGENLETAIAGTPLFVVDHPEDSVEELGDAVMEDMTSILSKVDRSGEGVCVQASTLGSLEALLDFLSSDAVRIPVSGISIGPVSKKDVTRASVMHEHKRPEFATILAFDVPVSREANMLAAEMNVRIFTADIIYHLFDAFTGFMEEVNKQKKEACALDAVFPVILKILPNCVFNKRDPFVFGVDIVEGTLRVGTPICVPSKNFTDLGRVAGIEVNHKSVQTATKGTSVAVKICSTAPMEATRLYGRHFSHEDELMSRINRRTINVLKEWYRDEMRKEDWKLLIQLKKTFSID